MLREHGFKGSGQNFKRDTGEQWQGINFQKSQWRLDKSEPLRFYLNLGVHFPLVECARNMTPPATFAKFTPGKADQRFRVHELLPDSKYPCFDIDGPTLEPFWEEFARLVRRNVVPAMDRMATREGLAEVCRRAPWSICSLATHGWLGAAFDVPAWDPKDEEAGRWKRDERGLWWGPGEW
jgi:hypothetical protein